MGSRSENWQFRLWTCLDLAHDVDFSLRKNFKITDGLRCSSPLTFSICSIIPKLQVRPIGNNNNGQFGVNFNGPLRGSTRTTSGRETRLLRCSWTERQPVFEPLGADLQQEHTAANPGQAVPYITVYGLRANH